MGGHFESTAVRLVDRRMGFIDQFGNLIEQQMHLFSQKLLVSLQTFQRRSEVKTGQALWSNDQILKYMLAQLPIARVGSVDEIASLALFLASPAASYCTGAVFTADGGYTI